MRSQETIKYEKMAFTRLTFNILKSDFPFLSDHFRPSGTQNEKKKCYRIICLKNNGQQGPKSDKISFFESTSRPESQTIGPQARPSDIMMIPKHG